jgi:hypothetical protein
VTETEERAMAVVEPAGGVRRRGARPYVLTRLVRNQLTLMIDQPQGR